MSTPPTSAEFVAPADVATRLSCSTDTVLRALDRGDLAGIRSGRLVRIRRDSVDAFIAKHSAGDQLAPRRRRTRRSA